MWGIIHKRTRISPNKEHTDRARTDNSTAGGIMNRAVKPKKFKSMDMRFCWLVDRLKQHN